MTISIAQKSQLFIIKELAYTIWPVAYGEILSQEQLDYMLDLIYTIESLEKQVDNNHVFLLVEDDNQFVGFASHELNFENSNKTKIQKLYVLPEIQGKGIGKHLINYIKQIAIDNKNSGLILNVNRFNKSKEFYLKYGFEITKEIKIDIGNNYIMDDYIMEFKFPK
ncbi:GNAT family N-acetyltransferase [Flavobacterium sp.]|uniref:GNAT family N-acetyltransferase n=1 Tax=Flavobacterium sp. TaxID=239 RepID=UPI000EC7FECF|nr:GNAT family N-acetyltransferase [Flavobacterium sp.]HCQ12115.1 GNAT family N-acetyltransferase [Flavobacterium sp.]